MRKIILYYIHKDIKRYFGFLFDRGYLIRDSLFDAQHFGFWKVVLESPNCVIEIYNDRNELSIAFTHKGDTISQVDLSSMIYFLSEGRVFTGSFEGNLAWSKKKQYERLSRLLNEYIDQITPYFGNDFEKHKSSLMLAQKEYNQLLFKRYVMKTKG
jgi:hypothetical protein